MISQDRWSLMAVVSQDRFHCTPILQIPARSFINTSFALLQYVNVGVMTLMMQ